MAFRIKFSAGTAHKSERTIPRRSVVQVYFAANHRSLAYYNDRFDLKPGDLVFVDGKLAGKIGVIGPTRMKYSEVTSVIEYLTDNISNAFKIKETEGEDTDE